MFWNVQKVQKMICVYNKKNRKEALLQKLKQDLNVRSVTTNAGSHKVPLNNTDFFRFLYNSCEREVSEFQREFETDPAFPASSLSKRLFLRDTNERRNKRRRDDEVRTPLNHVILPVNGVIFVYVFYRYMCFTYRLYICARDVRACVCVYASVYVAVNSSQENKQKSI